MTQNIVHIEQNKTLSLRERVSTEMERGQLSQSQVSSESGVNKTRLNQYLNDRYPGNNQEIEEQLSIWLSAREKRMKNTGKMPQAPAWVDTASGQRILTALSYAQIASDICCIYGGAGVGKTTACHHYAEHNPNVWITTMTSATGAVAASLERIAIAIGLKNYPGRASRLEMVIAERLHNTHGLLIIDEAQHLNKAALEEIRSLHDQTGIGVALVGNEIVYSQLTDGGSRAEGFAQLFSRIGKRVRLTRPVKGDVESLAKAWGLNDKQVTQELVIIASKPGALRGLTKTLRLASMVAIGKGVDMGLNEVRAARRDLGIE